jgi:5'-3' exonuclease
MVTDLIIDGNYVLAKLVFTLHKNNLLYGGLYKSLETTINTYRKWYPFSNIYLVSDSREKSWRKKISQSYKATRKKNTDIDWEFVYTAYNEFKTNTKQNFGIRVLEAPHIEGDDWISFLVERANNRNRSTIIISNDYDIKQLITYSLNPLVINIMSNEMYNKQKLFLPKNYQIFLNTMNKLENDLFELNDNYEFMNLLNTFIDKYEVHEVDTMQVLIVKLIAGDISDNISSAWYAIKNGKKRGIADKGAKTLFNEYITNFGEPRLEDVDLIENIADLICEKKKLSKDSLVEIKNNIEHNMKLILLKTSSMPAPVVNKMNEVYDL